MNVMNIRSLLIELTLFFGLIGTISSTSETHWNYVVNGPNVWADQYSTCAEHSQSPINIKTACTKYQSFPQFQFMYNYNMTQNFTVLNNGHSIQATQTNSSMYPMELSGGGLNGTYSFVNFHFHWGYNYKSGSEHEINGREFAAEIHLVHKNTISGDVAVLGIFVDQSHMSTSNQSKSKQLEGRRRRKSRAATDSNMPTPIAWKEFFMAIVSLNYTNASTTINLTLSQLINTNFANFYRYQGSLTTPPCTEGVTWTLFQTPIELSEDELDILRSTLPTDNHRPPQPLYERTVYRSFPNDTISTIPDNNCCRSNAISFFKIHNALFFISFMLYIFSFQIKD